MLPESAYTPWLGSFAGYSFYSLSRTDFLLSLNTSVTKDDKLPNIKKATYSFLLPTKQGQTQRKAAKHIFLEPKHPYDACTSVPLKHLNSSKSFHHAKKHESLYL